MPNELPEIPPLLEALAARCAKLVASADDPALVVGIRTGGLWVAEEIVARAGHSQPPYEIDIGFHRDDFDQRGLVGGGYPTRIEAIEDRGVLLVDDVIHSGRTIRAAMNALFEFGRPRWIRLAVLADRSGRALPIQPDFAAVQLDLPPDVRVKLRRDGALSWHLQEADA
ncbi:MAG: bifunctional pyr operon transcriptional regulator/uracil phosphoribosyltransferase PyrR [Planctomycetota bacterium]